MVFPVFPKLWNGPTALGESRAQVQVPGLPYQTTFAGNAETRVSGDFVDVYQKTDTGQFISWGDLDDPGWWPLQVIAPNAWFNETHLRYPVVAAKVTNQFAKRGDMTLISRTPDAFMRAPGGRISHVSGGDQFFAAPGEFVLLTPDAFTNYSLDISRDGVTFSELLSVSAATDKFATGTQWLSSSTFFVNPFAEFERNDRNWAFTRPYGSTGPAGWTLGLAWRDLQGASGIPRYTYRDTDGVVKTSTILDGGENYSAPQTTRVGPTTLVTLVTAYSGAVGTGTLRAVISSDNGRTWAEVAGVHRPTTVAQCSVLRAKVLPYSATECWLLTPGTATETFGRTITRIDLRAKVMIGATELPPATETVDGTTVTALFETRPMSVYTMYDGDARPTFALRGRYDTDSSEYNVPTDPLQVHVRLTQDFVTFEDITLPWGANAVGEPRWLNDTTILLPAYDAETDEHALYKSTDQFRTWTKIAKLWGDPQNQARRPDRTVLGGTAQVTIPKLNRFSTIEWTRDERGRPSAANPFSGRWICDSAVAPPNF